MILDPYSQLDSRCSYCFGLAQLDLKLRERKLWLTDVPKQAASV